MIENSQTPLARRHVKKRKGHDSQCSSIRKRAYCQRACLRAYFLHLPFPDDIFRGPSYRCVIDFSLFFCFSSLHTTNEVVRWIKPSPIATMSTMYMTAIAAGAFFHNIVRNREFDRYPFSILFVVIASHIVLSILLQYDNDVDILTFWQAQRLASSLIATTILSLWTNILVYRAFFHPLRNFPGPFGARLSKFWSLGKVIESKVRWYQVAGKLKEEYGDYVRTGNDIQKK